MSGMARQVMTRATIARAMMIAQAEAIAAIGIRGSGADRARRMARNALLQRLNAKRDRVVLRHSSKPLRPGELIDQSLTSQVIDSGQSSPEISDNKHRAD